MPFRCCTSLLVLAALVAATLAQLEDVPSINELSELGRIQNDTSINLLPHRGNRIVNGVRASLGQFPHQVRLLLRQNYFCGGAIISDSYILTAAHCLSIEGLTARQIIVRAGTIQYSGSGQDYIADSFYMHPQYDAEEFTFDVGVIKTRDQIQLSCYARPATLPPPNYNVVSGTRCTIAGWGRISTEGEVSNTLLYTNILSVTNAQCRAVNGEIHDTMLCAGGGTTGACFGDSGGALLCDGMIAGVASWVINECGRPPYYEGYARVAHPAIMSWVIARVQSGN